MSDSRKIRARDAVNDIRSGMTDADLMLKYELSPTGFQRLLLKLLDIKAITQGELNQRSAVPRKAGCVNHIDGTDMLKDIRSGMADSDLMEKYCLSPEELGFVLQTLTDTKVVSVEEVYSRSSLKCDTVSVGNERALPRCYLAVEVDVYESQHPEIRGTLRDVTIKGIGIAGIKAGVGEIKSLVISTDKVEGINPIAFEAKCRWSRQEPESGEWLAGLEIMTISEKCFADLETLVGTASLFG